MTHVFNLPRPGGKDIVTMILLRRAREKRQKELERRGKCLGTGSCDCDRCR